MIYTCTLNPSIDYIIHVPTFEYGGLNRGESSAYYPGGKGINVSRVLKRLDVNNTALGFIGDFTGDFIKHCLDEEAVQTNFIHLEGTTRINMKLKSDQETEINGPGPVISEEHLVQLIKQISTLKKDDILVASGSIPDTVPTDFYARVAAVCAEKSVKLVVDTSSQALKEIRGIELFLVKPNHHELGDLFDVTITSIEDAIYYGKQLHQEGAAHVLISMGGEGAVYIAQDICLVANVPNGKVINTVGAGDSMVAGFLSAYVSGLESTDRLHYAVATGSATAFNADLCQKKDVEALLPLVTVEQAL